MSYDLAINSTNHLIVPVYNMLEYPDIYHLYTQEVQFDQTACPLVGSGILDTWIILKTFLCFVLDSQGTYIYIYIYIYLYLYIYIYYYCFHLSNDDTPWTYVYWAVAKVELLDEEEAEQAKLSRLDAISCFCLNFSSNLCETVGLQNEIKHKVEEFTNFGGSMWLFLTRFFLIHDRHFWVSTKICGRLTSLVFLMARQPPWKIAIKIGKAFWASKILKHKFSIPYLKFTTAWLTTQQVVNCSNFGFQVFPANQGAGKAPWEEEQGSRKGISRSWRKWWQVFPPKKVHCDRPNSNLQIGETDATLGGIISPQKCCWIKRMKFHWVASRV